MWNADADRDAALQLARSVREDWATHAPSPAPYPFVDDQADLEAWLAVHDVGGSDPAGAP